MTVSPTATCMLLIPKSIAQNDATAIAVAAGAGPPGTAVSPSIWPSGRAAPKSAIVTTTTAAAAAMNGRRRPSCAVQPEPRGRRTMNPPGRPPSDSIGPISELGRGGREGAMPTI